MIFDYIFIGAGTANLAAANALIDLGQNNILILEKGNLIDKRNCPGIKESTCYFCKKGCFVTDGIGGANALHGNKLCYFPASNKVYSSVDDDIKSISLNYIANTLKPYFDIDQIRDKSFSNSKKEYHSDVLNKSHFQHFIQILSHRLLELNKIKACIEVIDISRSENGNFEVLTNQGKYYSNNIVIGTGRSGVYFNKKIFDKHGVNYSPGNPDIGFRIEAHQDLFDNDYYYQIDPKYKYQFLNIGSGRTFCAENQGFVVPVMFGKSFYADGAYGETFTNMNNVAIMVRSNRSIYPETVEEWCYTINKYADNRLNLGELDLGEHKISEIPRVLLSFIPIWPTNEHKYLMEQLLQELFIKNSFIFKSNYSTEHRKIKILGPATDYYWIKPQINDNFSTSVSNLFVIGDAIGVSRGYLQSIFSGVAWVYKLNFGKLFNNDVIGDKWSASV